MIIKNYRITKKDDNILKFCHLFRTFSFIKVKITPKFNCVENRCHSNVDMYINMYGGKKIKGYYFITNYDDVNEIIAIKHSIWYNKNNYYDITPFSDDRNYNFFIKEDVINFKSIRMYENQVQSLKFNICFR